MERLTQRDLLALLECRRETYAIRDLDAFADHVISSLPEVVPCEFSTYNEINHRRGRIAAVPSPSDLGVPDGEQILNQHISEHPFIAYREHTRGGSVVRRSDLFTRRHFHRLTLYNEFYRRMRVEHQMGSRLRQPPPLSIGIAL